MTTHEQVIDRFVARGRPLRGSNVFADQSHIYSYGSHFAMAYANDDKKLFVINGDTYSSSTSHHQRMVRTAIEGKYGYRSVSIPFSIMGARAANIEMRTIDVIDVGKEIETWECKDCGLFFKSWNAMEEHRGDDYKNHHLRYQHLLAPSLVTATQITETVVNRCYQCKQPPHGNEDHAYYNDYERKETQVYFLSGFDETARAWNGGYFFSLLPKRVKTIEEAFLSLRPKVVIEAEKQGIEVLRQGDIFAIPAPDIATKDLTPEPGIRNIMNGMRPQLLGTNHFATYAGRTKKGVLYARGSLYHRPSWREPDHRTIKLGNTWHRIVRNLAVNSWSVSGRVD